MFFKSIKIIITIIFFLANIQLAFSKELIRPIKKPAKLINEFSGKKLVGIITPKKKPTVSINEKIEEITLDTTKERITKK